MKPKYLRDLITKEEYEIKADSKQRIIGRGDTAQINIPLKETDSCNNSYQHSRMSRNHAVLLHRVDGCFFIRDNQSKNKTYILKKGEETLEEITHQTQIFEGDIIYLGNTYPFEVFSEDSIARESRKNHHNNHDTESGIIEV